MAKHNDKKKKLGQHFGYSGTLLNTDMSDTITVVTNITGSTIPMGFIPPHGKSLTAGQSVSFQGDLIHSFLSGAGRVNKRKLDHWNSAITNKIIRVQVQHRLIVHGSVNSAVVIPAGCLVWLDTGGDGTIKPAASFAWTSDLATTQPLFNDKFLGVAIDSHASTDGAVTNFKVDISSNSPYLFTCTSETHAIGDTFGPAKATGNNLENTILVKSIAANSCARGMQVDGSASTSVVVTLKSAFLGHNAAGAQ
jgi:hypothetical protein